MWLQFVAQSLAVKFSISEIVSRRLGLHVSAGSGFLLGGAKATIKSKRERCRCGVCGSPALQALLLTEV
jgi:hypothetical protein